MSWSEWCCFPTPGPQHGLWSSANTKHGGTSITSQRLLKAPRTGEGLASGVWSTGALTLTAPPGSLTQATHFPASTPGPGLRIPQTSARGSLWLPGAPPSPAPSGMHMGRPRLRVGLAWCPELPWAGKQARSRCQNLPAEAAARVFVFTTTSRVSAMGCFLCVCRLGRPNSS